MEKIERIGGVLFYGDKKCSDADEVYRRFREDYHRLLGKAVYRRLNVAGRKERIHGSGTYFTEKTGYELERKFGGYGRVPCRIMGFLGIGYVRMVGIWDCPDLPDDEFDSFVDWLFYAYGGAVRMVGRNQKSGRTSNRQNKRYR